MPRKEIPKNLEPKDFKQEFTTVWSFPDPGDLVFDIFAGSNTTGEAAEKRGRRWLACDLDGDYLAASIFRFFEEPITEAHQDVFKKVLGGKHLPVNITKLVQQRELILEPNLSLQRGG